jgi:hypothetical protein
MAGNDVKDIFKCRLVDDAAWIDFIQFPPCNISSISTNFGSSAFNI